MELVDILKNKKVKVTEIPKWGAYLRQQWESKFANHISYEEKSQFIFMMIVLDVVIYGMCLAGKKGII